MTMLILEPYLERRIIEERQALGHDAQDEVWDGVYVVNPIYDNEHQEIRGSLCVILGHSLELPVGTDVLPGVNVSDRDANWQQNYRCPDDVVVFTPDGKAIKRNSHSFGGPDFVVEVVTEGDRTWEKVGFYSSISVRELLIIERKPWRLSLLRPIEGEMKEVGVSTMQGNEAIRSEVIPFGFRLVTRLSWSAIEIKNLATGEISYAPEDPPLKKA